MKRRRYDSDSEDEANAAPQQAVAAPPQVSSAPQPPSISDFGLGGGTLFSKGKRTQLASELANRAEHGDFHNTLLGDGGGGGSAVGSLGISIIRKEGSGSQARPSGGLSLLDQLNIDAGASPHSNAANTLSSRLATRAALAAGDFAASAVEVLPISNPSVVGSTPPQTPMNGSFSSYQAATGNGGGGRQSPRPPPSPFALAPHVAAAGVAPPPLLAAMGGGAAPALAIPPALPPRPQVPIGLTSIRHYLTKGNMRPQMNCRIHDDESGRSGVWLPPSTILLGGGIISAGTFGSFGAPSGSAAAGAAAAAAGVGAEANADNASGVAAGGAGAARNSAAAASTMLTVKPYRSDRVKPLLNATVATTGPLPLDVLRSLKAAPNPNSRRKKKNSSGKGSGSGGDSSDEEGGNHQHSLPQREGGGRGRGGRGGGGRGEGAGRGGRGGGRGGGFDSATAAFAVNVSANSDAPAVVRHIDVGGGGLQHPYFNGYCSTILSRVAVALDAGVPEGVVVSPTSPVGATGGPSGRDFPQPHGGDAVDGASARVTPSSANITPALTVLSHSLTTREVLSLYCGGVAATTAKPQPNRRRGDGADADGSDAASAAAASSLAHSAATKPNYYRAAEALGGGTVRSGWRWDGITRGNPRMLAKYNAVLD